MSSIPKHQIPNHSCSYTQLQQSLPLNPSLCRSSRQALTSILKFRLLLHWAFLHQIRQSQVLPSSLFRLLRGSLNPKRRVLVWHYIVLVFWVDRLVMRGNIDFVVGQLVFAEIFEEVRVPRAVEVHVGVV